MECVARRIVLGVAGLLLIAGVVPFFTHAQETSPSASELQREVIDLKGQTAQLPGQIQALAVQIQSLSIQAAVLADHDKQREQRESTIATEILTLMGAAGLLLLERIFAALGWKLRDNARDHDPQRRREHHEV